MKPLHLPLEGHDLLAVERFKDDTRHMAEFLILSTHCPLGDYYHAWEPSFSHLRATLFSL